MTPNKAYIFSVIVSFIFTVIFSLAVAFSLSSKIDNLEKQKISVNEEVSMDSHSETNLQDIKLKTLVERYNEQKKIVSQEIDKLDVIKKEMGVDWSF